jgi:hypothetical protein
VHRGSDISSDHYLLISEIALWAKWRSIKSRQTRTQEEVYKVYLLQEESIRILYQWRLLQYRRFLGKNHQVQKLTFVVIANLKLDVL